MIIIHKGIKVRCNPAGTPLETAAKLTKQYGVQALGWAKDFISVCKSQTDKNYWRDVYTALHKGLISKQNPRKRKH